MGTLKSSGANLTINADGSGNDIKFQSNGSEVASISDAGVMTATSFAGNGANLTSLPTDSTKLSLSGGTMTGNTVHGDNVKDTYGASADLEIYHDGSNSIIHDNGTGNLLLKGDNLSLRSSGNESYVTGVANGAVSIYYDNSAKIETTSAGATVTGNIAVTGTVDGVDIATRDAVLTSTTTTAGAALPKAGGTMTGDLILGDNVSLELGAGSNGDLQIYHDASNSHIDSKTGILKIRSDDLRIFNQAGSETLAKMVNGGAVELYHNDSKKIETTSGGATVTGTLGVTTVDLGNWTITESSGVLYFATGGTNKMKLDASGNLTCVGDVTANGSM